MKKKKREEKKWCGEKSGGCSYITLLLYVYVWE